MTCPHTQAFSLKLDLDKDGSCVICGMTAEELKAEKIAKILALEVNDLESSYSGKPGCCCGCNGNHYCTKIGFSRRSKDYQSYSVVNEGQVKRVLNIIKKNAAEANIQYNNQWVEFTDYSSQSGRLYIIYLLTKG